MDRLGAWRNPIPPSAWEKKGETHEREVNPDNRRAGRKSDHLYIHLYHKVIREGGVSMTRETINGLIRRKVASYNKAEENYNRGRLTELWHELVGMQEMLKCMGIWLEFNTDEDFKMHYTLEMM